MMRQHLLSDMPITTFLIYTNGLPDAPICIFIVWYGETKKKSDEFYEIIVSGAAGLQDIIN